MIDSIGLFLLGIWFWVSNIARQCRRSLMNWRNVPAAFFFVLFAAAEYGNYQTGKDLARVCDSLGPHHVLDLHKPTAADPLTARQEIDNICIRHEAED